VEDIAVMNAEAYVLFYRKVTDKIDPVRAELQRLLAESQIHPGLMEFFISKQWFNKFENFAEPGMIFSFHNVLKITFFTFILRAN